jgi:hypothetical protein
MPCTARTPDGRCHPENVVYEIRGKRTEIVLGQKADVRIPAVELSKNFNAVQKKDLALFPQEVHLVMTPTLIRVSDIRAGKEETRLEFTRDSQGLKMHKEYDELGLWMALFRGLCREELNLNYFYENLARSGFYAANPTTA